MLAYTDEIHANRVGKDSLVDEIADDLRRMQRSSVRPLGLDTFGDVTDEPFIG